MTQPNFASIMLIFFRSLVLETVCGKYGLNDKNGIAFIYFNYQDVQKSTKILPTLIKQLCRGKKVLPDHLKRFHESYSRNVEIPSYEKLQAQFIELSKTFDQVFFVVDAMDECEDRANFLPLITTLAKETSCRLKVFVTSRREKDIEASFTSQSFCTVEIEATKVDADIATFVQFQIETRKDSTCAISQKLKIRFGTPWFPSPMECESTMTRGSCYRYEVLIIE